MNRRVLLACGVVAGSLLGATAVVAVQAITPWSRVGWAEWQRWDPPARQAWTDGFLAGAAAGQAPDSVFADSTRLVEWMTGRREGRRFPYGSNLYQARIQDWYFWENHRGAALWQGVTVVNAELRHGTR